MNFKNKQFKDRFTLFSLFYIICCIILGILFFWKEGNNIDFSSPINDEKISNYFTSIGSIGSVLALLLLYVQIKEMEKQRKTQHLPDLFPLFVVYKILKIDTLVENKLQLKKRNWNQSAMNIEDGTPYVILQNIGLGAAKAIGTIWEYDESKISELIKDKYYAKRIKILDCDYHDVLLKEMSLRIKAPQYYLNCCGELLNPDISDVARIAKPDLKLIIYFKTFDDICYKNEFSVQVTAYNDTAHLQFHKLSSMEIANELYDLSKPEFI